MILSTILNILNTRWLQACVLLCAVVILPFGLAYAQGDKTNSETYLEQVYEKLQAEVESGNMSAEDAEAKMAAVKKKIAAKPKT